MPSCSKCGKEIEELGKTEEGFCPACGYVKVSASPIQEKLSQPKHCMQCGNNLPSDATFCMYCGTSITQSGPNVGARTKFCQHCGAQIAFEAEICPKCGVRVAGPPLIETVRAGIKHELKNPGISAVLSFFFVGLGQIYNGQIAKGIAFIVLGIIFVLLMFVLIGLILYPLFWAYNVYDAYSTAKKINAGKIVT